jgi:serine/threonine-protein kinase RsbT
MVTAVSELARNILVYAGQGEICIDTAETEEGATVVVTAIDDGPGIADLEAAMTDGYSSGGGLGLGLPSARRLVDKFSIISGPGVGTRVTLWQKLKTEPRR